MMFFHLSRFTMVLFIVIPMIYALPGTTEKVNSCLSCHKGIEKMRDVQSGMYRSIMFIARKTGTDNRCIVCHGGNATIILDQSLPKNSPRYQSLKQKAHQGTNAYFIKNPGPKQFYPDPSSPWINKNSCALCHQWEVQAQWRSLMMTEAGKIQGAAWGFGGLTGYKHQWANYDVKNPTDRKNLMGTKAYQNYMAKLEKLEPNVFVDKMTAVPKAPTQQKKIRKNPDHAAFTYIRGECQRCHLGVGGKQRYGDYRGLGCSSCHIPYSNSGYYEGADKTIDRTKPGHLLVHSIQSTKDTTVSVGSKKYTGIPVETCTTCHNRGRRIGVSFQGLMETPYGSPWQKNGKQQKKLHGKRYIQLQKDLHNTKGFLCQDCHTSLDAHSANKLVGTITGAVEIECTDCHGTPDKYPWELPLGYGDEYSETSKVGSPRGLATELPTFMKQGHTYPPEDGYLLSARGNPLGNVVRKGNQVLVHLASGQDHLLSPLKRQNKNGDFSLQGKVAMVQVSKHTKRMECYTCHATWAPQCYGCHVKVDYSSSKKHYDWVALGHNHNSDGTTAEYTKKGETQRIPGEISETRSYLRWENPALAQNGEGRIAPVVPGCQTTVTVKDKKGKTLLLNHIFRVKNAEAGGKKGQLAIDMSPLHPHTVQKKARKCETCHNSPKALGYGIGGGSYYGDPSVNHPVDLASGNGEIIPKNSTPQIQSVPNLLADWSRFVTKNGTQLQTVGHHFRLSRPLSNKERQHISREGTCLACHQEIPKESLAVRILGSVAAAIGMMPETNTQHFALVHKTLLLAGWIQVLGMIFGILSGFIVAYFLVRRKLSKK